MDEAKRWTHTADLQRLAQVVWCEWQQRWIDLLWGSRWCDSAGWWDFNVSFRSLLLRWNSLKRESTRRLWTRCFTRRCRCPTTPCSRPRVGDTTTVALTARRRRGLEVQSCASVSVESTSRGTAHTTTGSWDTDRRTDCSFFFDDDELKVRLMLMFFFYYFVSSQRCNWCLSETAL